MLSFADGRLVVDPVSRQYTLAEAPGAGGRRRLRPGQWSPHAGRGGPAGRARPTPRQRAHPRAAARRRHPAPRRCLRSGRGRPRRKPAAQARRRSGRRRGSSRRSRRSATGWSRPGIPHERGVVEAAAGVAAGPDPRRDRARRAAHRRGRRQSGRQRRLRDGHRGPAAAAPGRRGGQPRRPARTGLPSVLAIVRRLANNLGGEVRVVSSDGTILAAYGRQPDGEVDHYTSPIVVGRADAGHARGRPAGAGRRPRRSCRCSTSRCIVGGVLSVLGHRARLDLRRGTPDPAAARRAPSGPAARCRRATARATGGDDRESAELADSFNAMADRLERSEMLRRRAASDIAHDLATPATVLGSQIQAMVDGVVPADARTSRRPVPRRRRWAAPSPSSTTSRAPRPRRSRPSRPRSISGPRSTRSSASSTASAANVACASIERARGDDRRGRPGHLARVLRNVVGNAMTHSPDGGTRGGGRRRAAGGAPRRGPGDRRGSGDRRRPTSRTSSSASTAPTPRAPSTRGRAVGAGAASGSRSPASSWPRTADGSASSAPTRAGPHS